MKNQRYLIRKDVSSVLDGHDVRVVVEHLEEDGAVRLAF